MKSHFAPEEVYTLDLLDFGLESRLTQKPQEFHQLESNPKRFFALTGSSARKLKRGQANLLAGRAFTKNLYALCRQELGERFLLQEALELGTLPKIFSFEETEQKKEFLRAYTQTYLKEEIQMETLTRDLPSFRRFLPLAATGNGEVLSWSSFARDVGVDAKTIRSYFEILEDTLVGFLLPAYARSLRKRQKTHPKFYFFDTGVQRALANRLNQALIPESSDYGKAFEHFFILELMRMNSYLSAERVRDSELRTLHGLMEEYPENEAICISREPRRRKFGRILVCPWQEAIEAVGLLV